MRLVIVIVDDCRQEFASQLAADQSLAIESKRDSLIPLARVKYTRVIQETNMEFTQQNDHSSMYQSNFRAEDGPTAGRSNALYEGVVVPLASLVAVFLVMLGAMIITN